MQVFLRLMTAANAGKLVGDSSYLVTPRLSSEQTPLGMKEANANRKQILSTLLGKRKAIDSVQPCSKQTKKEKRKQEKKERIVVRYVPLSQ
jgi:hypothetical protein